MSDLNPSLIDVDFNTAATEAGRMMGCNPRSIPVGAGVTAVFEANEQLIPESEWNGLIQIDDESGGKIRKLITHVNDQDGEPSCVSNAFLSAHEIVQAWQLGLDLVTHLSPISVYQFVGSRRSGSTLTDNMRRMQAVGALPLNTDANKLKFPHTHPANGYGLALPDGWQATAAKFKNQEWLDIESPAGFVTAILKGYPTIYARSGHCILGVGFRIKNGQRYLCYLNSWGDWGDPVNEKFGYGMGYDSERVWRSASYGSMALRSVVVL